MPRKPICCKLQESNPDGNTHALLNRNCYSHYRDRDSFGNALQTPNLPSFLWHC
jgi:hypothetical protein